MAFVIGFKDIMSQSFSFSLLIKLTKLEFGTLWTERPKFFALEILILVFKSETNNSKESFTIATAISVFLSYQVGYATFRFAINSVAFCWL